MREDIENIINEKLDELAKEEEVSTNPVTTPVQSNGE